MTGSPVDTSLTVIGSGSWGTALSWLLGTKGLSVRLWANEPEVVDAINTRHENTVFLPGVTLPETVEAVGDLAQAMEGQSLFLVVVPCRWLRSVCERMKDHLPVGACVLSAGKGLERGTGLRPTQIMREVFGNQGGTQLVALSGPNLARELVKGIPAATVVASEDAAAAARAQRLVTTAAFRAYTNRDVAGVELGGALKNVIAIGAGLNDGLGYGDNAKATLVTRGLAEIMRLGVALGAQRDTFYGLAGVGDLYATCASNHSRNHTVGFRLGQGEKLSEIIASTPMVAEGVDTTREAYRQAQLRHVEVPITEQLHAILFEERSPREAVALLMARTVKSEIDE